MSFMSSSAACSRRRLRALQVIAWPPGSPCGRTFRGMRPRRPTTPPTGPGLLVRLPGRSSGGPPPAPRATRVGRPRPRSGGTRLGLRGLSARRRAPAEAPSAPARRSQRCRRSLHLQTQATPGWTRTRPPRRVAHPRLSPGPAGRAGNAPRCSRARSPPSRHRFGGARRPRRSVGASPRTSRSGRSGRIESGGRREPFRPDKAPSTTRQAGPGPSRVVWCMAADRPRGGS